MSKVFRAVAAIAAAIGVGACATHPLPQDFAGVSTHTIVRKIRCEARTALKDNLTQWLNQTADPEAKRIGYEFASGRPLGTFSDTLFRGPVREIIQKFENSAIAYDFTFDMTETNNLDATLDLLELFRHAIGTAGISGGIDRTRQNIRTFTITDTFVGLLTKVKDDYCNTFVAENNYNYPITGTIGVGEMIHSFVELALFDNLANPSAAGPPTMADTITFTTRLSGSVAPKIVFKPVATGFHVADASLIAAASRTDAHKVIVALALPLSPPAAVQPAARQTKPGLFVTASGTPAELLAAHAVEQIIFRFELGRAAMPAIVSNP